MSAAWDDIPLRLAECTTVACGRLVAAPASVAILPVGSTEPHGPHLPLGTDAVLAEETALRAARVLRAEGLAAVVAPTIPYGVTDFAAGFAGAITLPSEAVGTWIAAVCRALRAAGFSRVCVTSHHLEPAHADTVAAAVAQADASAGGVLFANHLRRKWARTLSDEFRSGACHAGRYETSLVLAARPDLVDTGACASLPDLEISLAAGIRAGITSFRALGMERAYTGAPARADAAHGEAQYRLLVEMVVSEVRASFGDPPS